MLEKLKTKKIYLTLMIIVTLALLSIGSYALMLWASKENTELTFRIGEVAEVIFSAPTNEVTLSNMGPVFDYEKDGEIVEFSVTNIADEPVFINVDFKFENYNYPSSGDNLKYALMVSTDNVNFQKISEGDFSESSIKTVENGTVNEEFLESIPITSGYELKEKNYFRLIFYIDANEKNDISIQGESIEGSVNVAENNIPAVTTLANLHLTDSIKNDSPDFSKIPCSNECDEETVGIYRMEDDLGTSYYFRGDVENNYVNFAGYIWRIIRINGDGTVRMIYSGTSAYPNGYETSSECITGVNFNTNNTHNAYVGYMYGSISSSSTYQETHINTTESTIKSFLEETFYTENLTSYSSYIADAIYCNDRTLSPTDTGGGGGKSITSYIGTYRLKENSNPTLKCERQEDRFTTKDENGGIISIGNKKNDYSIGLITADEIVLAGAQNHHQNANSNNYLISGCVASTTMTPASMSNYSGSTNKAINFTFSDWSGMYTGFIGTATSPKVRPVISLNADALKYSETSNGSMEYPFTVTGQQ